MNNLVAENDVDETTNPRRYRKKVGDGDDLVDCGKNGKMTRLLLRTFKIQAIRTEDEMVLVTILSTVACTAKGCKV